MLSAVGPVGLHLEGIQTHTQLTPVGSTPDSSFPRNSFSQGDGDVSERLHREATKGGVRGFGRDHSFTEGFVDGWFWHIVYFWGTVCGV